MTDNRKCSFYIYPERNAADRVADGFLEKLPQKERGRAMRAMMLCGAALMKQDERLPFLIAEFLTESTSMQDIQRIISSTLPQQDTGEMARLVEAFLQATGGGSHLLPPAGGATPENSSAVPPNRQNRRIRTWKKPVRTSSICSRMMTKVNFRAIADRRHVENVVLISGSPAVTDTGVNAHFPVCGAKGRT